MTFHRSLSATLVRLLLLLGPLGQLGPLEAVARADRAQEPATPAGSARGLIKSPYTGRGKLSSLSAGPLVKIIGHDHVSATQYKDLRLAIQALLERYPAESHYFIGTGRDPAPIIAALENLGGREVAMNFPASNIVMGGNITPALLDAYFTRLIPDAKMRKDILGGRRTLVLLDQSTSGKTPYSLAPYFQAYFDQIGSPAKMIKLAFANTRTNFRPGVQYISTKHFRDVARYLYPPYEGVVSQYPRHVLGRDPISRLVERKAYTSYKAAVLTRMQQDGELDDFLHEHASAAMAPQTEAQKAARLRAKEDLQAKRMRQAETLPRTLKRELDGLISGLSSLPSSTRTSAYLSENARSLNEWLDKALVRREELGELNPELKAEGANPLVTMFMDKLETAVSTNKIRVRDYRNLMGHAFSVGKMNEAMLTSLRERFEGSPTFRRLVTKETGYFRNVQWERQMPDTERTSEHFNRFVQKLPAAARKEIANNG